jgi:DNA-binding NarL/FixJ family response regulator
VGVAQRGGQAGGAHDARGDHAARDGVLRELAAGRSNKEVAAALGIAEGTAKIHTARVFEKLGVSSRTEALAVALQRGLVRLPDRP